MNKEPNPLLGIPLEELEKVTEARRTLRQAAKFLHLQPHRNQVVPRRNGSNGNGHKMSEDSRKRISRSMKKLWRDRRAHQQEKVAA